MTDLPTDIPKRVGNYEVVEMIAEGGMGAVFKGRHVEMGTFAAVKFLASEFEEDETFVKRFEREARLAATLASPFSIRTFDVGQADGRRYILMEFVEGRTLTEILDDRGRMEEPEALAIMSHVAQALAEAHEHGIIHRDIKPDNIIINKRGIPKLADLGVAKEMHSKEKSLTLTGFTVGTPSFMSPEQAQGRIDIDARSDIYSLGATFYEALVGQLPFEGETTLGIMHRIANEPAPDPLTVNPDLSGEVAALIRKMMAVKREERFQTADALADHIEAMRSGTPTRPDARSEASPASPGTTSPPASEPGKPRPPTGTRLSSGRLKWVAAAVLLLVLLLAIVLVSSWGPSDKNRSAGGGPSPATGPGPAGGEDPGPPNGSAADPGPGGPDIAASQTETNSLGMTLVLLKPGTFQMGSGPTDKGRLAAEGPRHKVTLTRAFYLAAHEVTNAQHEAAFPKHKELRPAGAGDDHPVVNVSWKEALAFCAWLNKKDGKTYRLPTEAEWEYACRAGTETAYCWGDDFDPKKANSGKDATLAAVGKFPANPAGLYDMHGNAWEWCDDWYLDTYYEASPPKDPAGPKSGDKKILRGGSAGLGPNLSRAAFRYRATPETRHELFGFRVCREAK